MAKSSWDPYISVYKRDYIKKRIKCTKAVGRPQEFEDPVAEGFKHYLVLDEPDAKQPKEDGEKYLEKFKEKYVKAGQVHFQEPLQNDLIVMKKIMDSVTEYQIKYCDILKDLEYYKELKSKKFELPDDYEISITTYNSAFKDPVTLNSKSLDKALVVIPPNSLGTNEKINEILNVKTGQTEYQEVVGHLAQFILDTRIGNTPALKKS